jgi:protoporphyrin/coproporphyrin ferrochelatase
VNLQSNPGKTGVLLLAHGSPDSAEDVPEFLLRVTGGRALVAEIVAEVKHRYSLIGRSPLTAMTMRQGELLARELQLPVYVGMRNWKPFIAETLAAMQADGINRAVTICLAPQNSRTSVGLYQAALRPADAGPLAIDFVESWHDHPLLIQAFSEKLRSGWENACQEMKTKVPIVFTAHSVPQSTITEGDPYERQSKETAALVAREAAIEPEDWTFAFQSQGMSGGAWLGPTVADTVLELKRKGRRGVFIQPIGFLCDHVEVLYDIDVGFKQFAERVGMRLWRAESLNDSPVLTAALADLARQRIPAFAAKS